MHVLVVGAGIIGSMYGWALDERGQHVVHLVRIGRAAVPESKAVSDELSTAEKNNYVHDAVDISA